jgi:putative secretion ATPase (PEP-CTERM system associated)
MYEAFYDLQDDPFRLTSDPYFAFHHKNYQKAKAYMQFALQRAEGFVVITGAPGTGKTTLINELFKELDSSEIQAATLVNTQMDAEDLLRMIAFAFGLDAKATHKAIILQHLTIFFQRQLINGQRMLLVVDEAQNLTTTALEELRLLTNIQHHQRNLLQVFLLGQDGLRSLIQQPTMEQLRQRIIATWHLQALSAQETINYVRHRLEKAGWQGQPAFKKGVLPLIYDFSGGIPRRINTICSRLLLYGFINERFTLTADDVSAVIDELHQEEQFQTTKHSDSDSTTAHVDQANNTSLAPPQSTQATTQKSFDWTEIDQTLEFEPPPPSEQPRVFKEQAPAPINAPYHLDQDLTKHHSLPAASSIKQIERHTYSSESLSPSNHHSKPSSFERFETVHAINAKQPINAQISDDDKPNQAITPSDMPWFKKRSWRYAIVVPIALLIIAIIATIMAFALTGHLPVSSIATLLNNQPSL